MLLETIEGLGPAFLHAGVEMDAAVLARAMENSAGEQGQSVTLFEGHGDEGVVAHKPFGEIALGEDEPRVRNDLAIDAVHGVLAAVRACHDEAKSAAQPKIDIAGYQRAVAAAKPMLEMLGLGPSLEDEAARRIDAARHDDLAVRRQTHGQGGNVSRVHGFPPYLSVRKYAAS